MIVKLEQNDEWVKATAEAANDTFDALLGRGLSPGQIGMVANLMLLRLIEGNEREIWRGNGISVSGWKGRPRERTDGATE